MGTPSSALPGNLPPTTTSDQHFPLQHSVAPIENTPRLQTQPPTNSIFEQSPNESSLENSEPVISARSFPGEDDSAEEVQVIEHFPSSTSSTSSAATRRANNESTLPQEMVRDALLRKDCDQLRRLLRAHPALLNAQIPDLNCPPLIAAVRLGDQALLEVLLALPGIYVDTRDSEHRNAIIAACEAGHLELSRLLLAHGANLHTHTKDATPLIAACRSANPALFAYILKKTPAQLIDYRPPVGHTALVNAVICGKLDAIARLLKRGANPNQPGTSAMTALHHAADQAQIAIAKLLIRNGAIQRKSTFGYPLDFACRSGCLEMMELLLALPPAADEWRGDILMTAIQIDRPDLLEWLLSHGVPSSTRLQNQFTPLMFAIDAGRAEAAAVLITFGADVSGLSASRQSALSKAIEKRQSRDLILMLLCAMPEQVVLDRNLALRLIRRAKRRQDYRILNELATRKFEDRFGNAYELQGLLN